MATPNPDRDVRAYTGHLWRPAGLAWAAFNLAASAAGMFPSLIAAGGASAKVPLPGQQVLAAGQVGFLLTVYPLVLARRAERGERAGWGTRLGEMLLWLVLAAPFIAACGYLGDADIPDAVRATLLPAAAFPAAWGLAALARRGSAGASLAVLFGVLLVLGGPATLYLAEEFWPGGAPRELWLGCPVLFAWSAAQARQATMFPQPLWAWLWWPGLGILAMSLAGRHRRQDR